MINLKQLKVGDVIPPIEGTVRFGVASQVRLIGELPVQFTEVTGDFDFFTTRITSLRGCPKVVGQSLVCTDNLLTSLEGGPEVVGYSYLCYKNKLRTLKGAPRKIPMHFKCYCNNLTSFIGGPEIVRGDYDISRNPITSFEGLPKEVGGRILLPRSCQDFYNLPENLELFSKIGGGRNSLITQVIFE